MNKLTTTITTIAVLLALSAGWYSRQPSHPTSDRDIAKTTAMITNMAGNSGGTGVVLKSGAYESTVLTNAHVCNVAKFGGIVSTGNAKGIVTSYQVSEIHDLCLITVNANFGVNTEVTDKAPDQFDAAIVSGHPQLLPTLVTRGHFSDKQVIMIMTGFRACTKEEESSELALLCAFLGGIPVIKTFQSQVISSLIQPGSSGSAVFNDRGRIAGLVFAGSGNLSYGHIVPAEYVANFVNEELKTIKPEKPLDEDFLTLIKNKERKLKEACKEGPNSLSYAIVQEYCKYIDLDAIF